MTNRFLRASLTGLTVSLAIGPATPDNRLLSTWRQVNLQGMGFVTGALAHPTEPDLVYVRTDVGGMYRWDVTASAWIPLNDNKGTGYGIESFALDRSDPNLLYAGIGDRDTGRVWKSEDRGQSWQATGLVLEMEPNGDWRRCGERMAVDPHDGNRVYYGSVAHGLWTSRDRGTTWSSADTSALPAGIDGGQVCVLCDPSSGSPGNACRVVYVAVHGHGLFRSVDSGKSWDPVPGGPDTSLRPIHGAVTLGGNVYLTYHGATGALYTCDQESDLRDITPPNAGEPGFAGVDAEGERIITLKHKAGPKNALHYSTDSGTSWRDLHFNNGRHSWAGPDNVDEPPYYPSWSSWSLSAQVLLDPHHADRAWCTTGFGVYRTDNLHDSTVQWRACMRNLEELVATTAVKPPVSDTSPVFFGAMDMVGFAVTDPGKVPDSKLEVDEFGIMTSLDYCESRPSTMVRICSGQHQWWKNLCAVSRDNGTTWDSLPTIPENFNNGAVAVSATNPDHWVWAPENDFWDPVYLPGYTDDGGVTWHDCGGLPAAFNGVSHMWSSNQFVCSDRVDGDLFYYYAQYDGSRWAGFVYRSDDGGATFSQANTDLPCRGGVTIEATPGKEGHVFVSFQGGDHLYRSTNRGADFTPVAGVDSCDLFSWGAPVAPSREPTLFIAGVVDGVRSIFRSVDYGVTWDDIGDPATPVDHVSVLEGDRTICGRVYMGCNGRGFFYGDTQPVPAGAGGPQRTALSARSPRPDACTWNLLGQRIPRHGTNRPRAGVTFHRSAGGGLMRKLHLGRLHGHAASRLHHLSANSTVAGEKAP